MAGASAATLVAATIAVVVLPDAGATTAGSLPGGTSLSVGITSPTESQTYPAGSSVTVNGTADIGTANTSPNTALVTVIDNSGSTQNNGGACGNPNGDATANDVLDCEIASAVNLNTAAAGTGTAIAETGTVVFATAAVIGDVGPAAGDQTRTAPATDNNGNGKADMADVFGSIDRNHVGLFTSKAVTGNTNFADAISKSTTVLSGSTQPHKIVVFMSDGTANVGGSVNGPLAARPSGTVIYTFAVGSGSSCTANPSGLGSLQQIATATGGTCTVVTNPSLLPGVLPTVISPSLTSLTLSVDGGSQTAITNVTPALPIAGPGSVSYTVATGALAVGTHSLCVSANGTDSGGPGSVTECHNVVISPYPVTITALPQSKVYDAADPTFTYSVSGLQPGDSLTTNPTCAAVNPHINVGTYAINCSGAAASSKYAITYASSTLTVTPKPITVTADSFSKNYGAADPAFTYHVTGLGGSDAVTVQPTCTAANPHVNVGSYPISCTGASAGPNYTISYASGTLTVGQATVTITADNKTKVYGAADPAFTYSVSGLQNGDPLTSNPTCSVPASHANVDSYSITCTGADAGTNYIVTYLPGTLTVTPATVTITADSKSITYGQPDPPFTYTVSGLQPGDGLTSNPTCGVSGAHTAAGSYSITCSGAAAGSNYTISYVPGTLTINKAAVTITAQNQSKTYGDPDPAFTYTVSGLPAGAELVTNPTCGVAPTHVNVGGYPITCSDADAGGNYTITYVQGTLTVTNATITITAQNQNKAYGTADPAFTYGVTGLKAGDSLTTNPTCSVAGPHANAGTYPITCSGADAGGNYTVAYVAGTLTVTKATVTITPVNQTKPAGGADPAFTYTVTGLVSPDTLLTNPTCGVAGPHSTVGTYPITCSGADAGGNYTITYVTGAMLTVVKATPVIATTPSPSVPAGGLVSDSAKLTGTGSPTGTVTFRLYGPGDTTCETAIATRTGTLAGGVAGSGNVATGAPGTYRWTATYLGDANNNGAVSGCGAELVVVTAQTLTGRAYGLGISASLLGAVLLNIIPIPDTGHISTTGSTTTGTPCVASIAGLVGVAAVCANVTTVGTFPARSTANASVAAATIGIPTIPVIQVSAVQSTSTTSCAGSSGSTTIAFLKVGGTVIIAKPTPIAPNSTVNVGVVKLVLNEQLPFSTPDKGLTVNAIHVRVSALGLAAVNIVLASSESDIGNCP